MVSDYISVYADHAMDKQMSSADWSYLPQLFQHCRCLCPHFGCRTQWLLAKLW